MAWLGKRGNKFSLTFRFKNVRQRISLKDADQRDAKACLGRLEENIRLVERGRLVVPEGADLRRFLLSDGRVDKKVELDKPIKLRVLVERYQEC